MRVIPLERHIDARGELVVGNAPFEVKRAFWVHSVPYGTTRGCHAHKRQHQLLVMLAGSCRVYVRDAQGDTGMTIDTPHLGVHIPPLTYVELSRFSTDARLMVLASGPYDEADYYAGCM